MSRVLSLILLFGFGASLVFAAMDNVPLGQTIKDFVWPKRNDQGVLEANISGAAATAVSVNRTTIESLKIEVYDEDGKQIASVLTAPKADFWMQENRLSSQSGVLLKRGNMTITAQSMDWDVNEKTAVLRKQVRVVLNNISLGGPAATDEKTSK